VAAGRGRGNFQVAPTSVLNLVLRVSVDMSSYEHDPLADASYIRANFTYTPRNPKELSIKAGDVFHIHDEVSLKNCVCMYVCVCLCAGSHK